jgi:hypothetical protein
MVLALMLLKIILLECHNQYILQLYPNIFQEELSWKSLVRHKIMCLFKVPRNIFIYFFI